ncbi:hypothetical protein AB0J38_25275 [Streptomyces sp. NPDC050095]|uniref:hypothetical protein n=1 Tax=unclassified Streptomyces TaxID=2593676 RepID=UPI003417073A
MAPVAFFCDYAEAERLVEKLSARNIKELPQIRVQIPGVVAFADAAYEEVWWIAADSGAWSVESKTLGQVVDAIVRSERSGIASSSSTWIQLIRHLSDTVQQRRAEHCQAA